MGYLRPRQSWWKRLFTESYIPAYVMSTIAILISLYSIFS